MKLSVLILSFTALWTSVLYTGIWNKLFYGVGVLHAWYNAYDAYTSIRNQYMRQANEGCEADEAIRTYVRRLLHQMPDVDERMVDKMQIRTKNDNSLLNGASYSSRCFGSPYVILYNFSIPDQEDATTDKERVQYMVLAHEMQHIKHADSDRPVMGAIGGITCGTGVYPVTSYCLRRMRFFPKTQKVLACGMIPLTFVIDRLCATCGSKYISQRLKQRAEWNADIAALSQARDLDDIRVLAQKYDSYHCSFYNNAILQEDDHPNPQARAAYAWRIYEQKRAEGWK